MLGRRPGTLELISLCLHGHGDERGATFVIDVANFFDCGWQAVDKTARAAGSEGKGGGTTMAEAAVETTPPPPPPPPSSPPSTKPEALRLIRTLETLLHHERCIAVMHDCRRDCDALWHHLGLKPRRVHDTSVAHDILAGQANVSLNDTLQRWGMPVNDMRGRVDYISEPAYWAKRPLTREMVLYAAGDVHNLVPMAELQLDTEATLKPAYDVRSESERNRDCLVNMKVVWVQSLVPIGTFLGKQGRGLRLAELDTRCFFFTCGTNEMRNSGFLVYYPDKDSLIKARMALGWQWDPFSDIND